MKLLIKYCPIWDGYDTKALEVAKEITNSFTDIKVELIEGARGEFSVIYQDDPPALVYSMNENNRLPTNNEITSRLIRTYGMDNLKTNNDRGLWWIIHLQIIQVKLMKHILNIWNVLLHFFIHCLDYHYGVGSCGISIYVWIYSK